jgi:hypothetical protein
LAAKVESFSMRERAVGMTRTTINAEQVRVEADVQKWHERLMTEEKLAKANINLDKQLREKEVLLKEKKQNLKVLEAALVENSAHPQDDRALLSELVELKKCPPPPPARSKRTESARWRSWPH